MSQTEDRILIEAVRSGDTDRFGVLVERYEDLVFSLCLRLLRNREEAEEVAQDSFVKAWQNLHRFRKDAKFSTWLYRIAYNAALDRLRKKQPETVEHADFLDYQIDPGPTQEAMHALRQDEQKRYLNAALNRLPETDSVILSLYYLQDCEMKEIAEVTNMTAENVKVRLHRGRKKLYMELEKLLKQELKEIL